MTYHFDTCDVFADGRLLPPCATQARPGSAEKVAVLEWRWANGFHLAHPDDAKEEAPTHVRGRRENGRRSNFDITKLLRGVHS